jgi:hypothetical protein|tara:strand:- start:545 stop:967 length:423 start_codon:yes stop_codon:yes gene_type:complete
MSDTVGNLLNSSGEGSLTIEYNGKKYTAGLITQKVKAEFEKRMEKKALDSIFSMKDRLEPVEFREAISSVTRDIASGIYSFGSENSIASLSTPSGALAFASILFSAPENEVQDVMLAENDRFEAVMEIVRDKSFPNGKKV